MVALNRREFLAAGLAGCGCALLGVGCRGGDESGVQAEGEPSQRIDEAGLGVFSSAGVDGCFVLRDMAAEASTVVNPELASRGFLPASTFKIPNTLIGLETGVITDESFTLEWDGVRREMVAAWNRDHDLHSAMKHSVLWYFQEIARRIGEERYHRYLELLDYGNRDIGGGIDQFWVTGDLRVTAREQVAFLDRLLSGALPIEPRNTGILRRILLHAEAEGVVLRAKTGLAEQPPFKLGWMVGWVERPDPSHVFAALVLGPVEQQWSDSPVMAARREVPLRLLQRAAVVPAVMPQPV